MQVRVQPLSIASFVWVTVIGSEAVAQGSPARWLDLVQMPVAVARLELVGVPASELKILLSALDVRALPPDRFVESVRGLPLLVYRDPGAGWNGLGDYLRERHARGLRGASLADAVRSELRRRGIPPGPRHRLFSGHDVLHQDFLPPGLGIEFRERNPGGGGPGPQASPLPERRSPTPRTSPPPGHLRRGGKGQEAAWPAAHGNPHHAGGRERGKGRPKP